jgi:hypothetical protein
MLSVPTVAGLMVFDMLILEDPVTGSWCMLLYTSFLFFHTIPVKSALVMDCVSPHLCFNILYPKSCGIPLLF